MGLFDKARVPIHSFIKKHKIPLIVVILYTLLPLIAFWRNFDIFGFNTRFFHGDFIGYYYPDYLQGMQVFKHIFSFKPISETFWDPYNLLGFPLLGAVDRLSFFYPVRFMFYFVSNFFPKNTYVFFATYYSLFHMTLASIFTYIFVRRCLHQSTFSSFIAGLIYGLSGTFILIAIFSHVVVGPAFLPLQLYLLFQSIKANSYRRSIYAAFAFAPILVGGYTQTYLHSNMFILFFLIFYFAKDFKSLKKILAHLFLANFVAILISMVILIPSIEIQRLAERQVLNLTGSASAPADVAALINYIFPHFLGIDKTGGVFGYISIFALTLVCFAVIRVQKKMTFFLAIMVILFMILSLGTVTALHAFFYKLFPFYSYFRYLSFIHYIVTFNLALLAGYGLQYLENSAEERAYIQKLFFSILKPIAAVGLAVILLYSFFSYSPAILPAQQAILSSLFQATFFLGLTYLVITYFDKLPPLFIKVIIIIIIFADIYTISSRYSLVNSNYDPRIFISKSRLLRDISPNLDKTNSRVFLRDSTLRFNSAPEKMYQIDGFQGLPMLTYDLLINSYQTPESWIPVNSPFFDLLSVRYIITTHALSKEEAKTTKLFKKRVITNRNFGKFLTRDGYIVKPGTIVYAYENPDYLPRAYIVHSLIRANTDKLALFRLTHATNIRNTAIITTEKSLPSLDPASKKDKVIINSYKNSHITLTATTDVNSFLVLTDTYFPGWNAYIDGNRVEIFKTNVDLRGIFLNKGMHTVEFVYEPISFYAGFLISFVTCLALILPSIKKVISPKSFSKISPKSE